MNKKRVLVGSPVYQKPEILNLFLTSLKKLFRKRIFLEFIFVDDNIDARSSQLLSEFQREIPKTIILQGDRSSVYLCTEESHNWNDDLIYKVAHYKNTIIQYALENNYDYLFLVDSDLILHPNLIEYLKDLNREIVAEIFWSRWHNDLPLEPNVWLFDEYDLVPKKPGEKLTEKEKKIRKTKFLNQLRVPGLYEVGGLGACTLISRSALLKGVSFKSIKNLVIWGEDRFFCIRAAVLGIRLYVDTHYPAYHIYRESDLAGVPDYIKTNNAEAHFVRQYKNKENKITLSMVVKDEEKRYLKMVLNTLKGRIDGAVIIDDGSTDHTITICQEILKGIPLRIVKNSKSMFSNEIELRKKQWDETIKTNPDWILNLDADEILEDSFWSNAQDLINDIKYDCYCFRLYDMWDSTHYREDTYWNSHSIYRPFLIRYQPTFPYLWNEASQHSGRFPNNIFSFEKSCNQARIKHFGWATKEDREVKFKRYQKLDPDSIYGIREQYASILDAFPNLIKWKTTGEKL